MVANLVLKRIQILEYGFENLIKDSTASDPSKTTKSPYSPAN
jgi:hypothetical protein